MIYYDTVYLYTKILEQDKYSLLTERLNKITGKHGVQLEDILFSSNDELIPFAEMDNWSESNNFWWLCLRKESKWYYQLFYWREAKELPCYLFISVIL